jgi:hypothetical protein
VNFPREESLKAHAHASGFFEAGPHKPLSFPRKFLYVGTTNTKEKRQAMVYGAPIFQLFIGLFLYSM